jgi:hypothetical protein
MNRKEAAELSPFIKAFGEGRIIESSSITDVSKAWREVTDFPIEMIKNFKFRIKPEPIYRPFKDAEECWEEMQNHQPFGWVTTKDKGIKLCMSGLNQKSAFTQVGHEYDEAFDEFIFADGLPFGIKVEE